MTKSKLITRSFQSLAMQGIVFLVQRSLGIPVDAKQTEQIASWVTRVNDWSEDLQAEILQSKNSA
jgi:ribosomal protein L13E